MTPVRVLTTGQSGVETTAGAGKNTAALYEAPPDTDCNTHEYEDEQNAERYLKPLVPSAKMRPISPG